MKRNHHSLFPLFVLLCIIIMVIGCQEKSKTVFQKMAGVWQNVKSGEFERWVKGSNGTFHFESFRVKGNDTLWAERGDVYQHNGKWVSENTVQGQNGGQSVIFTVTLLTDNKVIFSNPAHDFPTDISYTVNDANNVSGFICGPNDGGGKDTLYFQYKRVK